MDKLEPNYVTSFTIPELKVREDRWGASSSPNLIPFQIFTKQADSIYSKDGKVASYYDGLTRSKINSINEISDSELTKIDRHSLGFGLDRYNVFFRPNPVVTTIHHKLRFRVPFQGAPMNSIPYLPTITSKGPRSMWLAAIQFIAVDIDFNKTSQKEADQLLNKIKVKPSTLVSSGNGYHAYYSVARIPLVTGKKLDFTTDLITSFSYENKLKALTSKISQLLGGDSVADNNVLGLLRVPETKNYKIIENHTVIKDCEYIYGDLTKDYVNPKYSFEELIREFCPEIMECKSAISFNDKVVQHNPKSRPKINIEKWIIAYTNFCKYFSLSSELKSFGKYFKYIYGHRLLDYYIENPTKSYGKRAGIKSEYLKRARDKMLDLGVITKLSDANREQGISAKYKPTELFYTSCGIDLPKRKEYTSSHYERHTLRSRMTSDLKWLKQTGVSREQAEVYIRGKLAKRKTNQADEEDFLNWGLNTFF